MGKYIKKEMAYERILFFTDAIIAIAITLLALDLKIEIPESQTHLTFTDLLLLWKSYIAFILSFIQIAGFWRTHHDFFVYIRAMDEKLMVFNIGWVGFIVTLPFASSVLSSYFGDMAAVFLYTMNILVLAVLQRLIWIYAERNQFVAEQEIDAEILSRMKLMLNLDILNALIALILTFMYPTMAFFVLFFKIPIFIVGTFYIARIRRKEFPPGRKRKQKQVNKQKPEIDR